jgi:acetyl esterase/lipase
VDPYSEGLRIASLLTDLDGPNVNPDCRTRVFTHGRRTQRALVLLHGFTNCPQQFDALGRRFHEQGWNVLIPRYPRHGYTDRLSTAISELRVMHLVAVANRSAESAHGLGEHVTVAGLSLGGALAGHLAQGSVHVDRAVLIAPAFGLKLVPRATYPALIRLAYMLPNRYVWWDRSLKDRLPPPYGYPRFPTRAYAALLEVGWGVLKAARSVKPRAREIAVITNAHEPALENRYTNDLVDMWRAHGAHVKTYEFPASARLPHDLIDPGHPDQNTDLVYPVVTRMIAGD